MPATVVSDPLKSGVAVPCRYEPGRNTASLDFARRYGTALVPPPPRKPKDKTKVEGGRTSRRALGPGAAAQRSYRDETAKIAALHMPRAHTLGAWGNVRSADGIASIVQPLIAPLYKGCSDIELVNYLTTGKLTRGYELVRDT